ncbi:restriction endonuclease subunit S [Bacteroides caccae]|uniref:restriction endonuclease subunit S n=1 Tax=Bacteroides caccae TaxID=47678 RepID=UPI0035675165
MVKLTAKFSFMEEYKLSDIAEVRTGPFGSQLHNEDYVSTGTPIVTVEHLGNRRFSKQNLPLVSDDDKKRLSKYLLQEGDIVFSRVGSVDRCSYVTSAENDWLFSGRCLRVRCGNNCHPLFLYYYFCKESVKQYIKSIAVGATMPSINTKLMAEIPILLPKLEEQRCIADILSSFDDKIELNRRINDNLEQQAQALFKAWFVDFEPFKDGEFVDDDFGRRPYGWNVKPLKYLVEKVKSGDWGKDEQMGNHTMRTFCMRGADFPDIKEGSKGKMPIRYILEKNFREKTLCDGNVVVEISGGSPTQSTGRIVLIDKTFIADCDNALICTNFCKSLEIKESFSLFFYFLWQYLYDKKVMFIYENGSNGLKNLNINSLLERELFVIPPKEIISRFNLVVSLLLSKKQANGIEISRLASLRDTLLPKLMSGNMSFDY